MSKFLIISLLLALGLGSYIFYSNSNQKQQESSKIKKEVNIEASFAIFTNGTLRDFSFNKYHNQSRDVFIEADNPMAVIVKKEGVTWDDFFKTLPSPMKLSKECLTTGTDQVFCTDENNRLRFYINNQEDKDVLKKEVKDKDKLLITYGNENDGEIKMQFKILK